MFFIFQQKNSKSALFFIFTRHIAKGYVLNLPAERTEENFFQ